MFPALLGTVMLFTLIQMKVLSLPVIIRKGLLLSLDKKKSLKQQDNKCSIRSALQSGTNLVLKMPAITHAGKTSHMLSGL